MGLCAGLLAVSAMPAGAAGEPAASPESIARDMFAITQRGDFGAYAKLMHPEALAEFQRMFREIVAADKAGEFRSLLFGVSTVAEFDAMTPAIAFERMMTNLTATEPVVAELMRSYSGEVIGSVAEGGDLVHVVYRFSMGAKSLTHSKVSALTLRKYEGEWRLLLSGNIDGIAEALASGDPEANSLAE
jgi:hypothetical protein